MARTGGAYGAMAATFLAGLGYAKATGRTRRAVDLITSVASDAALAVVGVDVEVIGEEHLWAQRPCVFIINHQSKIDMFLMMYLIRRGFTGVAKKEAQNTPGFGTFMRMADMAFIDRNHTGKAIDALKPAVDRLKQGLCVAIAPEGTRSWSPRVGPFKKGAFHMARQAGVPVVPVVIRNAGEVMGRNDQTMRAGTVQVAVLAPIDVGKWRPKRWTRAWPRCASSSSTRWSTGREAGGERIDDAADPRRRARRRLLGHDGRLTRRAQCRNDALGAPPRDGRADQPRASQRVLPEGPGAEPGAARDRARSTKRGDCDVLVVGVPSHSFRETLQAAAPLLRPWVPVLSLAKGLEQGTPERMTQIIHEELPGHPAGLLAGPNIAREVLQGLAAAAVLAMPDEESRAARCSRCSRARCFGSTRTPT